MTILSAQEEQVLCFESKLLSKYSSQKVFYLPFLWDRILKSLVALPRKAIEQNKEYKQLVVYSVIKSNDSYLTYKRTEKGGEDRLWKKYSLGVGGHVNSGDNAQKTLFNSSFFTQAAYREIDEEIIVDPPYLLSRPSHPKTFINDDSNDVGKVHFGLVFFLDIKHPSQVEPASKVKGKKVVKGKKGLAELEFCDIETLKVNKRYFEKWSQLIIDSISSGDFDADS
jgi:predicted NUDIX family phosphoesterase